MALDATRTADAAKVKLTALLEATGLSPSVAADAAVSAVDNLGLALIEAILEEVAENGSGGGGGGVALHATTHKSGGTDELKLHELGDPTEAVSFAGQQATSLCIENRTTDPVSPAVGQVWLRTDLL